MDPEGEQAPLILREALIQVLQCIDASISVVFSEPTLEHQRYNNCGPEVIENFALYLTGSRVDQESSIAIHSALLEAHLIGEEMIG